MWQRYNQTSHIFEKSTDNGVSWAPLPLSGSSITEGTIPNVAYVNVSNVFTTAQQIYMPSGSALRWTLNDLSSGVQSHIQMTGQADVNLSYNTYHNGSAWVQHYATYSSWLLHMNAVADSAAFYRTPPGGALAKLVEFTNIGAIKERGRANPIGHWVAWTPVLTDDAGNVLSCSNRIAKYMLIGGTFFYQLYLDFIVLPVNTTNLKVSVPYPPSTNLESYTGLCRIYNNSAFTIGLGAPNPGGTINFIRQDGSVWIAGSGNHIYPVHGFYQFQ